MIRFILLQNRQGKTRLAKYYVPLEEPEKHKVEYEVHRLVVNRDPKFTIFVVGPWRGEMETVLIFGFLCTNWLLSGLEPSCASYPNLLPSHQVTTPLGSIKCNKW
ncbi:hypothetical protein AMTRI_Chr09g20290 [Amborella trichopoda]